MCVFSEWEHALLGHHALALLVWQCTWVCARLCVVDMWPLVSWAYAAPCVSECGLGVGAPLSGCAFLQSWSVTQGVPEDRLGGL
jgi:hypothetical protein